MPKRLHLSLPKLILLQLGDFWYFYVGALIALVLTHYIQSHLPFLAKELADLTQSGNKQMPYLELLLMALGIIIFRTSSRLLFFYPARVMQRNLRVEIIEKLENSIPLRYKNYPSGQIFQTVYNDLEQIRTLVGFALLQIGNIIIACSILIPSLASLSPKLLIALSPMLCAFVVFTVLVSNNKKYYKAMQDLAGDVQNLIMESYKGKSTIKNYHSEKSFINVFNILSYKELQNFFKAGIGIGVSMPMIPLGVGLSLIWGALIIKDLELGASHLITFSGFSFLFLEPLMFVSWIGVVTVGALASWARIKELMAVLDKEDIDERFLADNNQLVLKGDHYEVNLNFWEKKTCFSVSKNKITTFIGKTGCGKTEVLTQMALAFHQHGIKTAYVSQDPYLYNDTLKSNIFLGNDPDASDIETAKWLLELFELTYINKNLDELLNMEVGENGKRLSGGQAKRLALIRSLILPSEVIIWDDPFSSVDVILEKSIFQKIKESGIIKDKTIIMCGHRLTSVKQADEVIYLSHEEGKQGILERGLVAELLGNQQSLSYEFFQKQMV